MNDYSQSPITEGNAFVTGFTVGLFAGAAGYYLFATDKGRKVRRQLSQEWENAKGELVSEGVIEHSKGSLRDFLYELFNKAFNASEAAKNSKAYQHMTLTEELEVGRKKARETGAKLAAKKDAGKRFRGV